MSWAKQKFQGRIRLPWRGIFSLFIVWHVIAIAVVGPMWGDSPEVLKQSHFRHYLAFFHLDRAWPFYAPNPQLGTLVRYQTVDSTGTVKTYPLTEAYNRYQHAFSRNGNIYTYLFQYPEYTSDRGFDRSIARYLCSRHAGEQIQSIKFIQLVQKPLSHQDYLKGARPLDPEYVNSSIFGPYPCSTTHAEPQGQ